MRGRRLRLFILRALVACSLKPMKPTPLRCYNGLWLAPAKEAA